MVKYMVSAEKITHNLRSLQRIGLPLLIFGLGMSLIIKINQS